MMTLSEYRKKRKLSFTKLSQLTGLDRRYLAELERGTTLASPETAQDLAELGLEGLPHNLEPIDRHELRSLRLERFAFPKLNREAWLRAIDHKPHYYGKLDRRSLHWLMRHVRADSVLECDFLIALVQAGATLRLGNPHNCGFRHLPIVDELGECLGERVLPCLDLKSDPCEFVLWPQVQLRPSKWTFRLDALILLIRPQYSWIRLEIDGPGHDYNKDEFRTAHLPIPTIRLNPSDLASPHLLDILQQQMLHNEVRK